MVQVVGKPCARCGERIGTALEGRACTACGAPVHGECAQPAPDVPQACASCCSPPGRYEKPRPPPAPERKEDENLASPTRVRLWGAYMIGGGVVFMLFARGWAVSGVPAPWVGCALAVFGLWLVLFPNTGPWRERFAEPKKQAPPTVARDAGPVRCEGVFATPVFAIRDQPFPVTGRGSLTLAPDGVEVSAFEVAQSARGIGLLVVIMVVVCGALLLALSVHPLFGFAILGSMPLWAVFTRMRAAEGKPATMRIPWPCVVAFDETPNGEIVLDIKHAKPAGRIIFVSDDGPEPLTAALHDRTLRRDAPA